MVRSEDVLGIDVGVAARPVDGAPGDGVRATDGSVLARGSDTGVGARALSGGDVGVVTRLTGGIDVVEVRVGTGVVVVAVRG
jgi:hypothetical protein